MIESANRRLAGKSESSNLSNRNMLPQPLKLTLYLASKRSDILEWISTIPYRIRHTRISDNRLEGTGEWILEKEYRNWRLSSESMLAFQGIRTLLRPSLDELSYRLNTGSSSGSRQNLDHIRGHRFFPFGSDSWRFRVLLLQSNGRKSSKSEGNTERTSSPYANV